MKRKPKLKAAAVLTIKDAARMSPQGKRRIIAWLRRNIDFFQKHAGDMSPSFRARYLHEV